MSESINLQALLDRIAAGTHTASDLIILRRALAVGDQASTVQLGKYNVDIGRGQDVQIGDRIYQGPDAAAISQVLLKILEEYQLIHPARPQVRHNLPNPDYGRFVGRERELAQVDELLSPLHRAWVVMLAGIGGIGKSALALEIAHRYLRDYDRLSPQDRFEAMIWTSAKATVLTADGVQPRQQVIKTIEDIYATIAHVLEQEDITHHPVEEQTPLICRALTRQRTLLVIDNLETVDDERVNAFIRELPAPTKCIITTRHHIDVAYPLRLEGMPEGDALNLIAQEAEKKSVSLRQDQAGHLYRRTGGVPLAIVWSVAQMGYGYSVDAVFHRLGTPSADIAHYCFTGAMQRIRGRPAQQLLLALALFATDASRGALGAVTQLPILDRDDGLVQLDRLSLVKKQQDRFALLPLTRSYLEGELAEAPEFTRPTLERMLAYYQRLAAPPVELRVGDPYWDGLFNRAQAQALKPECDNLVQAVRWALDTERYQEGLALFLSIVHVLNDWGLWDKRLQLGYEMCQAARHLGHPVEAWLWIDTIGWILRERRQFEKGVEAFQLGRVRAQEFNLADALTVADAFEGILYAEHGQMAVAERKIESALAQVDLDAVTAQGTPVQRIIARRVVGAAAWLSKTQQDYPRAKSLYESEVKLRELIGERTSSTLPHLGDILLLQFHDVDAAEKTFVEALPGAGPKDLGHIHYGLALVAQRRGELQQARQWGQSALEKFAHLGMEKDAQQVQELLDRL